MLRTLLLGIALARAAASPIWTDCSDKKGSCTEHAFEDIVNSFVMYNWDVPDLDYGPGLAGVDAPTSVKWGYLEAITKKGKNRFNTKFGAGDFLRDDAGKWMGNNAA